MTNACETWRRSFSVGRYRVDMIVNLVAGTPIGTTFEWSPHMPPELSPDLLAEYRQKRNRAHAALAEHVRKPVLMADEMGAVMINPDGTEDPAKLPETHRLDTGPRQFAVTIWELPDRVIVDLVATKYGEYGDTAEFAAWYLPLVERYDDDPRPLVTKHPLSGQTAVTFDNGVIVMPPSYGEKGHRRHEKEASRRRRKRERQARKQSRGGRT